MHCRTCKSTEHLYKDQNRYICKNCSYLRQKKYRETDKGKAASKRGTEKYELNNRFRRIAWNECKKLGSRPCEVCGEVKTDKHHPDYTQPLDVIWLCRLHHKEEHKKILLKNSKEGV